MQVVKTAYLRSPQEQYLSNDKCTYPILSFMTRCTSSIVALHHYQGRRRKKVAIFEWLLVCSAVTGLMSGTCTHFGIVT